MTEFEKIKKLAEQGHANAQIKLGVMYYNGEGVKKEYTEAARWFTKAAEQGDAEAQNRLGLMYYKGLGVKKDYAEAVRWYTKAAEQGHAYAQYYLGVMYYYGIGVAKNEAEAIKWYTKAAEQGHAEAQYWLDRLTPPTQKKRDFTRDFANKARLDILNNLQKEIKAVLLSYDGVITLAEAIGVLEIAKIELYNN